MLCPRCSISSTVAPVVIRRLPASLWDHGWTRLGRLICERCGGILPVTSPDPDPSSKATQLARFGLRTDGHTLLEP